ncbi:MAG: glutathione peroxidase [Thermoleophilia bacterium]
MTRRALAAAAAALLLAAGAAGCGSGDEAAAPASATVTTVPERGPVLLGGRAERIDGTVERLEKYRGKVVLVVNTASRCGFTPQFEGLQALYAEHRDEGFVILGFPSNDFKQELAENKAVAAFCKVNFGVDFPMFARVQVTGDGALPLFRRLAERSQAPEWNFQKYLLDRRGRLSAVYAPGIEPGAPAVTQELERLLAEPAPAPA